MDGLGPLIGMLLWGLAAAAGAIKKNKEEAARTTESAPPPPPQVTPQQRAQRGQAQSKRRAGSAVTISREAGALAEAADHAPLRELARATHREAQAALTEVESAMASGDSAGLSRLGPRVQLLHQRASFLKRLAANRTDPKTGRLSRDLATAVEAAVPNLKRRPLVFRGDEDDRHLILFDESPLLPLALTGKPSARPWVVGSLIEDAWASELLGDHDSLRKAHETASGVSAGEDAMGRFAASLAMAWAQALLLDAACTLSLSGGHAARVRSLAEHERSDELFVVRVDSQQRVDAIPPAGLRLLLLRRLLAEVGGPTAPPLPPNPVLHLRGPGVWDQVPLTPVLEHVARVQAVFAAQLAGRPGLQDPARVETEARELLRAVSEGRPSGRPDARVVFAALGLSATVPGGSPERNERLLEALHDPRAASQQVRGPRPRARVRSPGKRKSRKAVLRDAILLGESFGSHRA